MTDNEVVLRLLMERIKRVVGSQGAEALMYAQREVAKDFYVATGRCIVSMQVQCDTLGHVVGVICQTRELKGVTLGDSTISKENIQTH